MLDDRAAVQQAQRGDDHAWRVLYERHVDLVFRLACRVVKDRVGSVRCQAAARYTVTPAEIVAAAALHHPGRQHGGLDEDAIAEALAAETGVPYHKIDPLQVDNDLVAKTLSRPFARHHVVIPVLRGRDGLCLTVCTTSFRRRATY